MAQPPRHCDRLVTQEPAARRGRLESKGQIRKKQESRGSQEPSITGSWISPARSQRKGREYSPISAPSLVCREAESRPHSLPSSFFPRGSQTPPSPSTQTHPVVTALTGYTASRGPRRLWKQGQRAPMLPNLTTTRRVGPTSEMLRAQDPRVGERQKYTCGRGQASCVSEHRIWGWRSRIPLCHCPSARSTSIP